MVQGTWVWDGDEYVSVSQFVLPPPAPSGGGVSIPESADPPDDPAVGALWLDTAHGGATLVVTKGDEPPSEPEIGQLWVDASGDLGAPPWGQLMLGTPTVQAGLPFLVPNDSGFIATTSIGPVLLAPDESFNVGMFNTDLVIPPELTSPWLQVNVWVSNVDGTQSTHAQLQLPTNPGEQVTIGGAGMIAVADASTVGDDLVVSGTSITSTAGGRFWATMAIAWSNVD